MNVITVCFILQTYLIVILLTIILCHMNVITVCFILQTYLIVIRLTTCVTPAFLLETHLDHVVIFRPMGKMPLNTQKCLHTWEATALKRSAWRQTVQKGLSNFEETLAQQHEEKRMRRKAAAHADRPASGFICALCHRGCHSRIELASHTQRCTRINT